MIIFTRYMISIAQIQECHCLNFSPKTMTSAARPTFLPAMGGHSLRDTQTGPISYQSAKMLPAHKKLKTREKQSRAYKQELLEREQQYMLKVNGIKNSSEKYKELENLDADFHSDDSDSSSEEDDEEELMLELKKIKQEREQEKMLKEQQLLREKEQELEQRALVGNPLMLNSNLKFGVKRRWDDDVIFKNQGVEKKQEKRFINDMLRSDFHRKFMDKYIK